jgi:hypothetical protein
MKRTVRRRSKPEQVLRVDDIDDAPNSSDGQTKLELFHCSAVI